MVNPLFYIIVYYISWQQRLIANLRRYATSYIYPQHSRSLISTCFSRYSYVGNKHTSPPAIIRLAVEKFVNKQTRPDYLANLVG